MFPTIFIFTIQKTFNRVVLYIYRLSKNANHVSLFIEIKFRIKMYSYVSEYIFFDEGVKKIFEKKNAD